VSASIGAHGSDCQQLVVKIADTQLPTSSVRKPVHTTVLISVHHFVNKLM